MMATVGALIKSSLQLLGVCDHNQEPDATQYAIGIDGVNRMLMYWATSPLGVHVLSQDTVTLVPGQATYTIGQSGTPSVNAVRPLEVVLAFMRDGNQDECLEQITDVDYQGIFDKTQSGDPDEFWYNPTFPNGTLYLYPVPDTADSLIVRSRKPLGQYTSAANDLALPPEYEPAIEYNLAVYLAPKFTVDPSQIVMGMAQQTLSSLKRLHSRPTQTISSNPISGGNRFNIYRGY